ncbi:hypothetical protein C8A00DRAFT_13424 [Chaetomidium leptoderma]|uniref:Uncharacterized protein n=1 Tax=Chaetomidium leptoderma TaxID=669021 RepID=A0AAN6ZZ62_9PEZI|nr:hypothetical protein C8A00DRAFT_13424 [Chaetomidium leptoderma]
MTGDNYRGLEGGGGDAQRETRTCVPLGGLIKSSLGCLSRCWRPEQNGRTSDPIEKKYVHTPTHAASSFLKTTTTKDIQRANEIL